MYSIYVSAKIYCEHLHIYYSEFLITILLFVQCRKIENFYVRFIIATYSCNYNNDNHSTIACVYQVFIPNGRS